IVNNILSKNKSPIIIVHAALFIETQSFKRYDSLIVVYSKNNICYKRLLKRDNIDEGLASSIIASQLSIDKKLKYANFIINNNKGYDNLKVEVERIYNILEMYEKTKNILLKNKLIDRNCYKST
ncbi:MAG: dephospho-CoA kinase, partial [Deferribacterota bacterium]|nr:dephospho-CoA kinase [Deferribacterota bacterium]